MAVHLYKFHCYVTLWMSAVGRYILVLNVVPCLHIQKRATDKSWLLPGPAIQMWHENDDGIAKLAKGVPDAIPVWPLWGKVVVDHIEMNQQKELI